jgi:sugar lactone lactonase YvrE
MATRIRFRFAQQLRLPEAATGAVASLVLLCALVSPSVQAADKGQKGASNPPTLVWPSPPDAPRIAYVQSLRGPADFGIKKSIFGRFSSWLTGSKEGQLKKPFGISFDEKGNLCFTDTGANVVYWFDRPKKTLHHYEQVGDVVFASPVAVIKRGQTLYVADSGLGCVVMFDERGHLISEIKEGLVRPAGLALTGNHLFVVDAEAHAVVILDLQGHLVGRFGGRGSGLGEFNFPSHINADAAGDIFVTDSGNARIQVFDTEGHFRRLIGSLGDAPGHLSRPKGVATDGFGHLYVLDAIFDNLQLFDQEGRLLMVLGHAGDQPGEFWLPNGIAINASNEIFVADSYNRRIQVFKFIGQP